MAVATGGADTVSERFCAKSVAWGIAGMRKNQTRKAKMPRISPIFRYGMRLSGLTGVDP